MKKNRNSARPESQMMSYAYKPELSEGAVKVPLFMNSSFCFPSAEEGKAYFELAYGLRDFSKDEQQGLIYSRINNPNLEILEERLCLWDQADQCAVFSSGMSAISTVFLEFLKPGDLLLYSTPVYGGTDHFINHFLESINVKSIAFDAGSSKEDIIERIIDSGLSEKLALIYIETPANPTNQIIDIEMCKDIAKRFEKTKAIPLAVDNTYMGPVWSQPLKFGADVVIYSATKFLGGHSDLIAGAVLGKNEYMQRIKTLRTFLGNMSNPHTCWLLSRSLETLKIRMEKQADNAHRVALWLKAHPMVKKIEYLGLIDESDRRYELYKKQYDSGGSMIAFELYGTEAEAFQFLNQLKLIKLAVSLGSTESLIQHPASMTHIGIEKEEREKMGITDSLLRLSVGIENPDDLINDLSKAFESMAVLMH